MRSLVLLTWLAGCTFVAPVDGASATQTDARPPALASRPRSCDDLAKTSPVDGDYTVFAYGNPAYGWPVRCVDMQNAPKGYLMVESATNYASLNTAGDGGRASGASVKTAYRYVRVLISSTALEGEPGFQLDGSDQRFADSDGVAVLHDDVFENGVKNVSRMPLGVAMSCSRDAENAGQAALDLRGTRFVIAHAFSQAGDDPKGAATVRDGGQRVEIVGGGRCGWVAPVGYPNGDQANFPVNNLGGLINLAWQ